MKINTIDLLHLTNEDAYGFMNEVARQLNDVCKKQPDACKEFIDSLSAYNEVLKGDNDLTTSKELNMTDAAADKCWRAFNQYLNAMLSHPKEDVRNAATVLYDVFSKYENPTNKSFATEYGIMERLIDDLNHVPLDIRLRSGAQCWIEDLDTKCRAFTEMYKFRVQEQSNKVPGGIKTSKLDTIAAYREMIKVINALLIVAPTAELEAFATYINALIDQKRIVQKAIKTRNANAKITQIEDE